MSYQPRPRLDPVQASHKYSDFPEAMLRDMLIEQAKLDKQFKPRLPPGAPKDASGPPSSILPGLCLKTITNEWQTAKQITAKIASTKQYKVSYVTNVLNEMSRSGELERRSGTIGHNVAEYRRAG